MDRNTIIGFILIFVVFLGFSYLNRPTPEQLEAQKHYQDSIAQTLIDLANEQQRAEYLRDQGSLSPEVAENDSVRQSRMYAKYGDFAGSANGEEELTTLENGLMKLQFSNKGGRIYSVELKNFKDYERNPLVIFEGKESDFNVTLITTNNRVINTRELFFEVKEQNPLGMTLSLRAREDASLDFVYTLHPDDYMVDFNVVSNNLGGYLSSSTSGMDFEWTQKIRQQERGRAFADRYARLSYKYLSDDVEQLRESKDDAKNIANKLKWIGYKDQFFSSVLIARESFEATQLISRHYKEGKYLKEYTATTGVPYDPKQNSVTALNFYFGPNDYKLLQSYDRDKFAGQDLQLEKLVPLGWWLFRYVNKWIIIPIFDWLTSWCGSLGIAILLLTLIVKFCLFPLMYKSFISSAKMRVLKPQIAAITEKYPGQDNAMTRQQKTMELYNQVGINPMAGCLPMLLQMPILLALFMFFPSAIELRQQSFLWADDLSTYDSLIHWNTYIPFVSKYFGNHISIFCLLMSAVQIINTKYMMEQQGTAGSEQMPGMKFMMYSMPLFMFFILNSYPAGLNYYYLVSTLIAILQTVAFRFFIDEEKLLAKLEANKKNQKVKKKSGFMQRLEEAQRRQQALLKEQQKQQQKGGKGRR